MIKIIRLIKSQREPIKGFYFLLYRVKWVFFNIKTVTHGKKCTGICFADNQMCCSWAYFYNIYILYIQVHEFALNGILTMVHMKKIINLWYKCIKFILITSWIKKTCKICSLWLYRSVIHISFIYRYISLLIIKYEERHIVKQQMVSIHRIYNNI